MIALGVFTNNMDQKGGGEGFFIHVYNDLVHSVWWILGWSEFSTLVAPLQAQKYFFLHVGTCGPDKRATCIKGPFYLIK